MAKRKRTSGGLNKSGSKRSKLCAATRSVGSLGESIMTRNKEAESELSSEDDDSDGKSAELFSCSRSVGGSSLSLATSQE